MGCLFNITIWDNSQSINNLDFSEVKFWVQVHNLIMDIMNKKNARKLGVKLGKIIKEDFPFVENRMVRSFLRIRE